MNNSQPKKLYFDQKVQNAIVEYINEPDYDKRNRIYERHIHKVFQTLVVNIMHKRKVYYATDDYDIVKNDALGFIITKLEKYKQHKGKAFSYFTVITQRYMQTVVDRGIKNRKRFRSIDCVYQNRDISPYEEMVNRIHNNGILEENTKKTIYKKTVEDLIIFLEENQQNISKKKKDIGIINAVISLLKDRNSLEKTHKKAIYFYIRQITSQNSISISRVLKKINKHYVRLYNYNKNNNLFISSYDGDDCDVGQ